MEFVHSVLLVFRLNFVNSDDINLLAYRTLNSTCTKFCSYTGSGPVIRRTPLVGTLDQASSGTHRDCD